MIPEKYRLKNTIKYPTSLIIGGLSKLGLEIADSLIEQGGYVIVIDTYTEENIHKLEMFPQGTLISFLDYTAIPHLDEDIRRLDYVFYFGHESADFSNHVSTQQFLTFSNYLDATLSLTAKFDAKFLLTTAIRAHQLVLSNQEVGLNYGLGINAKHTVYTDMEVQKYAESLAMEYVEKTKLNARIIRLGEIIGDGIDFAKRSTFVELIVSAAKGEPLKLKKDGLETEWYIHILDAAYGIIKAQFSRNTEGQIYSLAYEHPFTNLAVAYKIQEFDSDAKEIIFIDEKDNLPSLKLYKPAPNLAIIGWAPKINFEKAIKQSVAAAKIYLLENNNTIKRNKSGLVDKIKGFLAIADSSENIAGLDENSGPIGRLIAERKRQEELKNRSIEYAADTIKNKKRKRVLTFKEKLQNTLWSNFLKIGDTFNILKNKTPTEMGVMFVLFIFAILFYVYIFSPFVLIGKDILIVVPEFQRAKTNYAIGNYSDLTKNATNIENSLKDAKTIFDKYEGIFNVLAIHQQFDAINTLAGNYITYADGVKNISYSLEPFADYISKYAKNTQTRSATDSFLSITSGGLDYSNILSQQSNRQPYLDNGIASIRASLKNIGNTNYNLIPTFLAKYVKQVNTDLSDLGNSADYIDSTRYLNELLGVDSPKSYLLLVLDNTRETPAGGEIAAFAIVTVKNGSLSEVVVQSPDEVNFNFSSISPKILKDINARKFTLKTQQGLNINDIGSIQDYSYFSEVISGIFKDTYKRDISGVLSVNYTGLDTILKALYSQGEVTEVNSVKFDDSDFLQHLKLTQTGNESIQTKHMVTAQILASVLDNILSNTKSNVANIMPVLTSLGSTHDLLINSSNLDYSQYIVSQDLNAQRSLSSGSFVLSGMSAEDLKVVSLDTYPSINTAAEVKINSDLTLNYSIDVKFPSIGSAEEISVCIPIFILDSSIKVEGIPSDRYVINSGNNEKCMVVEALSETDAKFSWEVPSIGSTQSDNVYKISLSQGKIRGANVTSDYKVTLDPLLKLMQIDPNVSIVDNSAIFTQTLQTDQELDITLSK